MTEKIQAQINKIREALKHGEQSLSELTFRTNMNFYVVQARLEEMLELGIVEKRITPRGTYWKLKEETIGGIAA